MKEEFDAAATEETLGEHLREYRPIYKRWWFWAALIPLLLLVALVIYRIPAVAEQQRTAETVAFIESQRITLDDVMGTYLPPHPDPSAANATIEGIDVNQNGIRDDVELAIFERYPDEPKIRAAMLQYAMALQQELNLVINKSSWVAATQQIGRAFGCIYENVESESISDITSLKNEVEELVRNTQERNLRYLQLTQFQTTFSASELENCDVVF
ncbi:hypothetical protein COU20_00920 [Candidatus Kaiserbacteria bacterium CG10_big_fil_rev_8_21_14_0_10_59_10]|uniref:Uncharacterized protein n=1 Tax=Candidatus Kaiserbacteria bacterium CG10_big_fil_rev_8_21_14_0_10_59_10 TaxID=1974612 RepID=A0A2H0UAK1_9BACT|nr:MAG: hypothetical protein COU20_00920 [Candidatus Kaiserbacteria bacterium CG10_big_fil_rev_8_21_14_0_10_59_10]